MTKRLRTPVPFQPFVPLPKWTTVLERGTIDSVDLAILYVLAEMRHHTRWETTITLVRLAEVLRWPHTIDALSKRLRRLKKLGVIHFAAVPGRRSPVYKIRLQYDHPLSEVDPSTSPEPVPSSDAVNRPSRADGPADSTSAASEDDLRHRTIGVPRRAVGVPSTDAPPAVAVEPNPPVVPAFPLRAAESGQEPTSGIEDGIDTPRPDNKTGWASAQEKLEKMRAAHPEIDAAYAAAETDATRPPGPADEEA